MCYFYYLLVKGCYRIFLKFYQVYQGIGLHLLKYIGVNISLFAEN